MTVSVVIAMYNASKTIISTLESVLNQTYKVLEIIIVNDGSTDSSGKIVADYIISHPQVDIKLLNQDNQGVSAGRNKGLRMAKGEWIALLDSDDVWLPIKIQRQLEIISRNPKIDFLGTARNDEIYSSFLFKRLDQLTLITNRDLLYKMFFVTPTLIFKREILDEVGYFDESQRYLEDGNLYIRIATRKQCYLLNESLVVTGGGKAHFGVSGLSSNMKEMENGELKNLKYAYNIGIVNIFEYLFLITFSILKYYRRILIVTLLR